MITFQYQILRYLPDRVNEEFINLGVVVFDANSNILSSRFVEKTTRVTNFFSDVNGRLLSNTLKFLKNNFNQLSLRLSKELNYERVSSLQEITSSILPYDDSSVFFSEIRTGIDVNIEIACDELFENFVVRNLIEHEDYELRSDREVWNKVYKDYFEKTDILKHLQPHTINTKSDKLQFEKSYKNGQWNCFESVSFNLVKPESVKNKVYKWVGKFEELKTSSEPVSVYLLSVLPDSEDLKLFIKNKLNDREIDSSKIQIVTEDEIETLTDRILSDIKNHS